MVDLDALARDARRTSEWGRARMACRIVVVIAALARVARKRAAVSAGLLPRDAVPARE